MAKSCKKSLTVDKLVELLREFDGVHGTFPEHEYEGKAVGVFVMHALGFSFDEVDSRFNLTDPNCRLFLTRESYERTKPRTLDTRL